MILKSVHTIAVGNNYYRRLAKNLLLSFLRWNDPNHISFQLITDEPEFYSDLNNIQGVHIQKIELKQEDKSFVSKFHLAQYINATQNLFIDCDCIIYKPLHDVFEAFKGLDFSVIGEKKSTGEFFGDISNTIKQFNITYLPHFVGSVYYYTNSETSKKIFEKALELKTVYDKIGLVRLRGKENEEPLLAIAMALYNQVPLKEDGTIKADCMYFKKCETNVVTGKTHLTALSSYKYCSISFNPAIVHFNDRFSEKCGYLSENFRLNSRYRDNLLCELLILLRFKIPLSFTEIIKNNFRPIYHSLSKPSSIKSSKRVGL